MTDRLKPIRKTLLLMTLAAAGALTGCAPLREAAAQRYLDQYPPAPRPGALVTLEPNRWYVDSFERYQRWHHAQLQAGGLYAYAGHADTTAFDALVQSGAVVNADFSRPKGVLLAVTCPFAAESDYTQCACVQFPFGVRWVDYVDLYEADFSSDGWKVARPPGSATRGPAGPKPKTLRELGFKQG